MKKNLLILNYEFPPLGGGAGNATYYFLKELAKYPDVEVDLVTSSVGKFRIEKFAGNVDIHYLDIKKKGNLHVQSNIDLLNYSRKAYFYSKQLMKVKKYHVCHAFFGIPCGYIAMKLKIPYIVSLRGSDVPFYNKRYWFLDRFFFQRLSKTIWENAKEVVANSGGLRDLALESYSGREIRVIPNGVDVGEFALKKKSMKKKGEKIKIVSVGRLIPRKGYEYLIKALKGKENFELTLIGDGDLLTELKNLAKKMNVKVYFSGRVKHEDIADVLQEKDIFVLPSLNEGMSNAILEAMACGLPIVATDTGGSKELVKKNGFLVEKRSVNELKEVLEKFEKEPNLILEMGYISREIAEQMNWGNIVKKYLDLYEQIIHE